MPTIGLPNGTACYLPSKAMRLSAKFLRWEIFEKRCYVHPGFELRPTDTVVDVGGNVRLFVLWAAPQVPQGRVLSVEPIPATLACLQVNVDRNSLGNVIVVHAALGSDGGTMELVHRPGWELFSYSAAVSPPWIYTDTRPGRNFRWLIQWLTMQQNLKLTQSVMAAQMSLGRLMDDHQLSVVNYLKIHCEGSEFEILRHIGPQHWARIERLAIEYHEYGRDRQRCELVAILEANGFEVEIELQHPFVEMFCRYAMGAKFGRIWARRRAGHASRRH